MELKHLQRKWITPCIIFLLDMISNSSDNKMKVDRSSNYKVSARKAQSNYMKGKPTHLEEQILNLTSGIGLTP